MAALITVGVTAAVLGHGCASASSQSSVSSAALARSTAAGGEIPTDFAGLSLEWSLVERYMGPNARPVFAQLLRNLGSGALRVGGSSQDQLRFDPEAANTNRVITREDLADIRATLDASPGWRVILGTAMAPNAPASQARRFLEQGVGQAFAGDAARDVLGIELGNEPDVTYHGNAGAYLRDFASQSGVAAPLGVVGPNTSEVIAPWTRIDRHEARARAWDWPKVLGAMAPAMRAGGLATSHFYPVARRCAADSYRCATISRLLSDERMDNLRYAAYSHARAAARAGLRYRVEEVNSAANRGVHGVSDVAASATWALDAMFNAACPQPPDGSAANADCSVGAVGVNFHNAEVRAFSAPEEGNAYYNPVGFDRSPAMAGPSAAPVYYALLLFARFAQGTHGLRPVPVRAAGVKAWRVDVDSERRLFVINKGERPVTVTLDAPGTHYELDRMAPHDPTRAGRTLDAPEVRIDGREVAPDGTWPGFQPAVGLLAGRRLELTLRAGEVAVARLHP
jgi:hypothetical protein